MIQTDVFKKFTELATGDITNNKFSRQCSEVTDSDFIQLGIHRVLGEDKSGRAFLQRIILEDISSIERTHFFKCLKSKRRLDHLKEACHLLLQKINALLQYTDRLKIIKELYGIEIFGSDGSYHEWACHDEKFEKKTTKDQALSEKRVAAHKTSKRSVQHFYSINLRTKMAHHLTVAQIGGDKQKEHDIHALKRLDKNTLRLNIPKGTKVLQVYDRASLDFPQWIKWKNNDGIYFLSRDKSNSALQVVGQPPYDKNDPINKGVISNETVGTGNGEAFRRVIYQCPETKEIFSFLTTLSDAIRPGVIVMLYKLRWEVEKLFDSFKNKLEEKKAWASSETAKTMQALFLCLTHNLAVYMNQKIEQEDGLVYTFDKARKEKNHKMKQETLESNGVEYTSTWEISLSVSQITIKFYRWLRIYATKNTSWNVAVANLGVLYATF